jgi:dTDP-4-dehydrorhamnose reductase
MKILITGITGLLGTELAKTLCDDHEIVGLSKTQTLPGVKIYNVDICDQVKTYDIISKVNPDIVIHTATMTNVDDCERNPDKAFSVNALGTRNVAVACQRFDTVMCYISTDYAFSGENAPKTGYTEFDTPAPVSVYAKSKSAGEEYVKSLLNKYFIVRTSWLFGSARKNFVSQIASALAENKPLKAAHDMVSSPTNVKDLAIALSRLIDSQLYGTYHISNSGFASRFEIASMIAELMGAPTALIEKVSLKDFKLPANRPCFSGMRNYVWQLEGFKPLRPWQEAVTEFLAEQQYL